MGVVVALLVDLQLRGNHDVTKMGRLSMSAFLPTNSARKCSVAVTILVGLFWTGAIFGQAQGQVASGQDSSIPNFSPSSTVGWLKSDVGDEFLPPDTGPGPVVSDPAHGFVGSYLLTTGNAKPFKIADLSNPILQPWVVEKMRKTNEEVLAGKVGFTARSRCWPHGVPGFLLYPVHPIFFIQASNQVVMTWGQDFQLRRVERLCESLEWKVIQKERQRSRNGLWWA